MTETTRRERLGPTPDQGGTRFAVFSAIAERVEDANTMAVLWQAGIEFLQGYQVQEPEVVLSEEPDAPDPDEEAGENLVQTLEKLRFLVEDIQRNPERYLTVKVF